ncbi:MAG: substrate-binding domain-containing protein [Rubrivivax sp.]|jgi:phosphate transport system substrate-binding protein|nr:substrate-binding domain-containing protein [Rubrivivax sp.]
MLQAACAGAWLWAPAVLRAQSGGPGVDAGQVLRVGGVGSVSPVLKRLATAFGQQHANLKVRLVEPPLGSTGALRALAAGGLDLAVTGRPLLPQETGVATPWVRTPLVLATSDGTAPGLSLAQVADAYAGRLGTWPDGRALRLVLRSALESETLQLKALSPEVARSVDAALQRRDLPVPDNDLAALDLLARLPGSLGSSSLGLVLSTQARVRVLRIEGREPTLANLLSGVYPWDRTYFLVQGAQASPAAQQWVAFLKSDAAMRILHPLGYAAAR